MEEELHPIVKQLVDMGFELEKAKIAFKNTKNADDIAQVIEYIQNNEELLEKTILNQQKGSENQSEQQQKDQNVQEGQSNENKIQEEEKQDEQLKPVSDLVDQEMAKQLQEMGHSKNVAEKALFMTQGKKTIEAALDYIEEHKNDEDFQEQLFITGSYQQKSQLSDEEARLKAKEMQAALRMKREKEEEEAEFEREKKRREMGKVMNNVQNELLEAQKKRDVQQQVRERQQFEIDKKKMQDQLDRDYIERFGMEKFKKWKAQQSEVKEKSQIEKIEDCIKSVVTALPQKVFPDKAMTCLKTIKIYIEGVIKNPTEEKFRKINSQNAGYKKRVGDAFGGQTTLEVAGFKLQEDGFLFNEKPDMQLLNQVIQLLDKHMKNI